ncbi:MAG: Stk1 family PASTA domain-containing Ser/Thr kinase [Eubacterium sp.]|jgi:serine/threonine protein kinase/beta-lactam-binding protein with PASTA domain|nr:Stk1 family PASTA domain-containing Ser/Thr kinase [Eubacterium sp.]
MLSAGMFVADRYEIIGKIGAGGMSDVYKARDHILGRNVAIKVLKQEFSEDVNFVVKFRTEAQSAAGLEHPNIVNIYDVGSESGMHYIVMEYVEGVTLKTYIEKKGRLTYKEAVSIAIQVGRGMEAAHAKNIIHRDIKPQNILISTEGKAKVTDFGIARAVSNNTISADVMGSVHYASPEQARNGFVNDKSDIYSLGIVMYEMVTGRVPFDGETTVAIAIQHLQEEMVVPSVYAQDLPISLEKIILKCTQKSADRRYANISELLRDLKEVLVNPNADFVKISDGSQNRTRVISEGEVREIKSARALPPEPKKEEYAYPAKEQDEEEEEEEGFLNPRLEKAVTIGGILAAVIIIGIVVYLVGNILGIFGGTPKKQKEPDTQESSVINTEKAKTEQVAMIKVMGMTFSEAKSALKEKGLGIWEAGKQASDEYEAGQIMSQDVEEGAMVDVHTTINVYISTGAGEISVPNVEGYDSEAAINMLQDHGFLADRRYEYSDTVASGKVISQSPSAESPAKKGDTVQIVVSQGKEAVAVPGVLNKPQEEAVHMLTQAGLNVTSTSTEPSDTIPKGNVINQSIAEGKYVDRGTGITLVISSGSNKTYYWTKFTVSAPDSDDVVSGDIVLIGSNGTEIQSWENIRKFPHTITANDIENCDSGTIKVTWHLSDGSTSEQTQNVIFNKQ